jgi:chemotaxis protein methyltransferase CheR
MPRPLAPPRARRAVEVPAVQLDAARALIARRFGFWIKDDWLRQLETKIASRMALTRISELSRYLEALHQTNGAQDELQALVDELLIHETSFFRHPHQFEALRKHVFPSFVSSQKDKIRIASLGCSSGEEAYSIAITAHEAGLPRAPRTVEITGLDASARVLAAARKACYSDLQLREIEPEKRTSWFSPCAEGWELRPHVRGLVRFCRHNLLDPLPMTGLDVLFCCNVLIYFSPQLVARLLESFHAALNVGGYLFLGHSESALRYPELFRPIYLDTAIYLERLPSVQGATPPAESSQARVTLRDAPR